jgi:ABC-type glucose/galactose transport system permease subunit
MMLAYYIGQSTNAVGAGYEMEMIANCILGGKSVPGGVGAISCANLLLICKQ